MRDSVVRNRINLNKIIKIERKRQYGIMILRGFLLLLLLLLTKDVTVDFVPTFICFNFLSFAQTNLDLLDLIDFFTDRKF